MATFEAQVEGLTSLSIDGSSAPTQTELTQFLSDGAMEIINSMPPNLKMFCATEDTFTSTAVGSEDETLDSAQVLSVTRRDGSSVEQPCRLIPPALRGRVSDSDDMNAATTTDPVYYIYNGKLNALPASGACKYLEINNPTVAYGDSSISNFPDEYEYLVPLYASIKYLQNVLGSRTSNNEITTALTAMNTELDETLVVCDLINTQVDAAVIQIAEASTQVDAGVDTALAAITTAAGRINTAVGLANLEFDKSDALLDLGEADSEAAVNTALTAIKAEIDECLAIADNIHTEVGLVNAEIDLAKTEAAELATQTDNSGDFETALDAMNTALDKFRADGGDPALFGDESSYATGSGITRVLAALTDASDVINNNQPSSSTDAYGALANEDVELVSSALSISQAEIARASAHLAHWSASVSALTNEADGFSREVSARSSFSGAKSQAIQGYINTAGGYASVASGYANEIQKKIEIAGAYANEINSRLAQASTKREESQSRISSGNAYLSEANAASQEVSAYANEVSSRIAQVGGYGTVVSGYISSAQGYANEIQSKINIAQGYSSEVQARLSVDTSQYGWYEKQQQKLQADYDRGIDLMRKA